MKELLTGTFAYGTYSSSYGDASLADPPMWFVLLLALFMLVIFTVVAGGSIVLAASLYRNFLRPDVKQAPLSRTWTVVVIAVLTGLLLMATGSPYAGWVALKSILLLLVAITAWAVIWRRTEPKKKAAAKRGRTQAKSVSSRSRK